MVAAAEGHGGSAAAAAEGGRVVARCGLWLRNVRAPVKEGAHRCVPGEARGDGEVLRSSHLERTATREPPIDGHTVGRAGIDLLVPLIIAAYIVHEDLFLGASDGLPRATRVAFLVLASPSPTDTPPTSGGVQSEMAVARPAELERRPQPGTELQA